MASQIKPPVGPPLGFPKCPQCTYLQSGPPRVCLACSSRSFENITSTACSVCSQTIESGSCSNWLCLDPNRRITRIRAIAYFSGELQTAIKTYKYNGKRGWSLIFGRLLVAWLDQNSRDSPPDLIIANPTFISAGSAAFGHTETVIEAAAIEDVLGEWPFDVEEPLSLLKVGATSKSADANASARRAAAAELPNVLQLPDSSRVQGRRILVYDDVCTTGSQLDAVARYLINEGNAAEVSGIVLARAPWRMLRAGQF